MDQEIMTTELVAQDLTVIPAEIAMRVFTTPGMILPWINHVKRSVELAPPADVTTLKGRKAIASLAFDVSKSKTYLEGVGKELADTAKALPKKIDATRKHIKDTLDALRDDVRAPLDQWEAAEEDRVTRHRDAIEEISSLAGSSKPDDGAERTLAQLVEVREMIVAVDDGAGACDEFASEYQRAKIEALAKLDILIPARRQAEADAAELATLRAEAAARKEQDDIEAARVAFEAAEKVRADRKAAAEKDEADRQAAEIVRQQEELAAAVLEAEQRVIREAEEAKAADEAATALREKNRKHRGAINTAAAKVFEVAGFTAEQSIQIVKLIATKAVPNISISY